VNFDGVPLLPSPPNRPDYVNVFGSWLHPSTWPRVKI
jgi:hypothetical protein